MNKQDIFSAEDIKYQKRFDKFILSVPIEEGEIIKEFIDYGKSRYFVSSNGKVYSICNNEWIELIQQIDKDGYYYVDLYEDGVRRRFRVHQLVANCFLDNPEGKEIVHHKNLDRSFNDVQNLVFLTDEEHRKIHKALKQNQNSNE